MAVVESAQPRQIQRICKVIDGKLRVVLEHRGVPESPAALQNVRVARLGWLFDKLNFLEALCLESLRQLQRPSKTRLVSQKAHTLCQQHDWPGPPAADLLRTTLQDLHRKGWVADVRGLHRLTRQAVRAHQTRLPPQKQAKSVLDVCNTPYTCKWGFARDSED